MSFKIAIPSYNRANLIKSKTLKVLDDIFQKKYEIYLFTPQTQEYGDLPDHIKIEECKKGLNHARNHIMNFFNVGENILMIDDDIDGLLHYDGTNTIENEILNSFKIMNRKKIKLGGFNPTGNRYFSRGQYKLGLNFCVGCCYLLINDRNYMYGDDELEDYKRSIEYYKKYGANFRNDKIIIKTNYETNKGGMFCLDRYDNKNKQAITLLHKYPDLVTIKMKKNYLGIQLKKNKKTEIVQVNYKSVPFINGQYSKNTKSSLDPNKNYFFMDGSKVVCYILRNVYHLPDDFKYSVESNQNSGDIAGIITKDKLPKYAEKYFDEYKFNKQKTRTSKTQRHKFEISNEIKRKSKYICDCPQMTDIYNRIGSINIFNKCNKVIINKNLCSAFHRDQRNDENYVLLITKNNKLVLDIPEYVIVLNNNDGDIVVGDFKSMLHGNNEGECKDRYSFVFYSSKKK